MDPAITQQKIQQLEQRIIAIEEFIASLKNPSQLPPEVLSALKALGL